MRNVLLTVAVLAIAATGYFIFSGDDAALMPAPTTPREELETALEDVGDALDDAVEAAGDVLDDTVAAASDAVSDAIEEATTTGADVLENAQETTTAALDSATQLAQDTAATASAAAQTGSELAELLTVEGFDYDRAVEIIEESDLSDTVKTTLTSGLDQARDNPDLLADLLEQARTALGL